MKKNFNKPFVGADGKPAVVNNKPQNIAEQLSFALFNLTKVDGAAATPEQKYKAYNLMKQLQSDPENVELSTEDGTFIKSIAADIFSAGAYGQVVDIIEN